MKMDATGRRHEGTHDEVVERANLDAGQLSPAHSYQGSVEPIRRPDHKAKSHSRPAKWEDRHARRERQAREWAL